MKAALICAGLVLVCSVANAQSPPGSSSDDLVAEIPEDEFYQSTAQTAQEQLLSDEKKEESDEARLARDGAKVHTLLSANKGAVDHTHTPAPKKAASKAQHSATASPKPKGRVARLEAKQRDLIAKEMGKPLGRRIQKASKHMGSSRPDAANAASTAALAASKAVGTLEDMKAEADQDVANTQVIPKQTKAQTHAAIMKEAEKSAAKTLKRLHKEEAKKAAQDHKEQGDSELEFNAAISKEQKMVTARVTSELEQDDEVMHPQRLPRASEDAAPQYDGDEGITPPSPDLEY